MQFVIIIFVYKLFGKELDSEIYCVHDTSSNLICGVFFLNDYALEMVWKKMIFLFYRLNT